MSQVWIDVAKVMTEDELKAIEARYSVDVTPGDLLPEIGMVAHENQLRHSVRDLIAEVRRLQSRVDLLESHAKTEGILLEALNESYKLSRELDQ